MLKKISFIVLSLIILNSIAYSEVKVASIFCDHMVIQQNSNAPIWGWAMPDEKITISPSWQSQSVTAVTDSNGSWKAEIKTPVAGGPYNIKVKGSSEVNISDVLAGEVWICSGQSNMEVSIGWLGTERSKMDIAQSDNNQIRVFDVKDKFSLFEEKDCTPSWKPWMTCTPDNIQWFSAVGYYFGKRLNDELNVPIGLISTHWGGTPAESWMDVNAIKKFKRMEISAEIITDVREKNEDPDIAFGKIIDTWLKKIASQDQGMKDKWYKNDVNDSNWFNIENPNWWGNTSLKGVHGIVWFRKEFNLTNNNSNMELDLGKIDDIDSVWINNKYIGSTIGCDVSRLYRVPAEYLNVGKNIIAVRVIDTGGDGGFTGDKANLKIYSAGKEPISLAGIWKYKNSNPKTQWDEPRFSGLNQNFPSALFNGMVAPLIPFKIAGVIWYQGEANAWLPIEYRTLFPAMIQNWRQRWAQGDFPFYYVQIAPWDYGSGTFSQALREAQMMTLSEPNTGMAVTMDIGEEKDIHPKNKHDVGDRLARWALNKNYGRNDVVFSGPIYKEMKIEGNSIRIFFDYAATGLRIKGSELSYFTIAGSDKKFYPAKAIIDGQTVRVSSPKVEKPVAVRFAWTNCAQPNLYNAAFLPASSFRTDDWPLN
ncbi:MAG: sialate O-acetylesterase [Phycisphaerales bacterium]